MKFYGIDFGCTSIKYGLVELGDTIEVSGFNSTALPENSDSAAYARQLISLVQAAPTCEGGGFGLPTVVWPDRLLNIQIAFDDVWNEVKQHMDGQNLPVFALNDADAAGMAEVYRYEAAGLRRGVTVVITLGTGIGSAVFLDGRLLPNSELGLFDLHGMPAEKYAAASVKTSESLSMQVWAGRLQEYLSVVERLLTPDHLVLGGGISADFEKYNLLLKTRARLQPAYYRNVAGVVGAALYAAYRMNFIRFGG